ncbi:MAG TPA: ABC transporter permease, partial [Longimicrobiaceae bacterium]
MKGLFARARSLWRGLRRPDRLEAEMDEEMRFHMEMEAERLAREQGLEPREARRRAAVLFGGVDRYKEEGRDVRGITRLAGMSLDFRLGVRMLLRSPGLTAVAVLALSVAIGGGAAYLEFVNDLIRPRLPFPDGGRVVGIYVRDAASGKTEQRTAHDFLAWRGELESVRDLGAFQPLERNLITPDGRTEPVEGVEISASAFRVTRVPPLLGRPLVEADEEPGAPPVAVLGHDLWRSRFGGDPGAVGRTVRLGSAPVTVVGVMPPGFAFPVNHGLWVPLRLDGSALRRGEGPAIRMFGRLAPGVGLGAAQAELGAAGLRAAAGSPDAKNLRPFVEPYVESLWSSAPDGVLQMRMMYALNLFFLGLLGVCGANVATLVFARTMTRAGEITVRTALGASRGRIAAQLFAEALVLTSVAALVGLAAAALGLRWVKAALVAEGAVPPFWWDDRLAPETLLYAVVLAVLAAVVVGVVPALRATGPRLQAGLKHAAAGGSGTGFGGVWTGVIVTQVALTVVFLLVVVSVGWNVRVGRYGAPGLRFAAAEYLS